MVSRTWVASVQIRLLEGLSRAMLLRTCSYAESTSLKTCAVVASADCWLRLMSMRVRCFSP